MANRMPRVALVVTITVPHMPPVVLLDVERTGNIPLIVKLMGQSAIQMVSHSSFPPIYSFVAGFLLHGCHSIFLIEILHALKKIAVCLCELILEQRPTLKQCG